MKRLVIFLLFFALVCQGADLKVTQTRTIIKAGDKPLCHPVFSPDGSQLLLTQNGYRGLWLYDLKNKSLNQLTDIRGAGYGANFSADGKEIILRHDEYIRRRKYSRLLALTLKTGSVRELTTAERYVSPAVKVSQNHVFYLEKGLLKIAGQTDSTAAVKSTGNPVVYINDGKLHLVHNGSDRIIEPVQNGSYIWPSLSPDKSKILFTVAGTGTFITDLDGNIIVKLGTANAPQWSADGRFIVFMKDIDDGHRIISSDIYAMTADGNRTFQLTNTENVIEMYPQWSPANDKIACHSLEGDIIIIDIVAE